MLQQEIDVSLCRWRRGNHALYVCIVGNRRTCIQELSETFIVREQRHEPMNRSGVLQQICTLERAKVELVPIAYDSVNNGPREIVPSELCLKQQICRQGVGMECNVRPPLSLKLWLGATGGPGGQDRGTQVGW